MRRALLSVFTATCLVLFISANALNYVFTQELNAVSLLDQTFDDTEESENQGNENKKTEVEDDDNQFLIGHCLSLTSFAKGTQTDFSFYYRQGHQLEVNSPPPQF